LTTDLQQNELGYLTKLVIFHIWSVILVCHCRFCGDKRSNFNWLYDTF